MTTMTFGVSSARTTVAHAARTRDVVIDLRRCINHPTTHTHDPDTLPSTRQYRKNLVEERQKGLLHPSLTHESCWGHRVRSGIRSVRLSGP